MKKPWLEGRKEKGGTGTQAGDSTCRRTSRSPNANRDPQPGHRAAPARLCPGLLRSPRRPPPPAKEGTAPTCDSRALAETNTHRDHKNNTEWKIKTSKILEPDRGHKAAVPGRRGNACLPLRKSKAPTPSRCQRPAIPTPSLSCPGHPTAPQSLSSGENRPSDCIQRPQSRHSKANTRHFQDMKSCFGPSPLQSSN